MEEKTRLYFGEAVDGVPAGSPAEAPPPDDASNDTPSEQGELSESDGASEHRRRLDPGAHCERGEQPVDAAVRPADESGEVGSASATPSAPSVESGSRTSDVHHGQDGTGTRARVAPSFATATEPPFESLIGKVIDKRYRIEALLAVGGMGAVYRAEQVFIHRKVALKLLHPSFAADPEAMERFRREAEIAAQLRSPHVVDVLDFGQGEEGRFYLTMELLPGESVQARLDRERRLPPEKVVALLRQLLPALGQAHAAGIVHRDLKPENLWLVPAPDAPGGELVKILDFGIAKLTELPPGVLRTRAGMVMGTPEYLAPEQAFGRPLDRRADLYSLGLITFQLLTGRHPYVVEDVRAMLMAHAVTRVPKLGSAVPELADRTDFDAFIARATEKDPDRRADNAAELLALLGDAAAMVTRASSPVPSSPLYDRTTAALAPPRPLLRLVHPARPSGESSAMPLSGGLAGASTPQADDASAAPLGGRMPTRLGVWVRGARTTAVRLRLVHNARAARLSLRARRIVAAIGAAIVLAMLVAVVAAARGPIARARRAIADHRPEDALRLLAGAHESGEASWLKGRALHQLNRSDEGIDAYRAAAMEDLRLLRRLDSLADLSEDLRGGRSADAQELLVLAGDAAVDVLLDAAADPHSHKRRWAGIEALRALDKGDLVDVVGALILDLKAKECSVVRDAARSLGDLGDERAVVPLREVADRRSGQPDACGAGDARAALRRLGMKK